MSYMYTMLSTNQWDFHMRDNFPSSFFAKFFIFYFYFFFVLCLSLCGFCGVLAAANSTPPLFVSLSLCLTINAEFKRNFDYSEIGRFIRTPEIKQSSNSNSASQFITHKFTFIFTFIFTIIFTFITHENTF